MASIVRLLNGEVFINKVRFLASGCHALLVCVVTFHLSGKGGHKSIYATESFRSLNAVVAKKKMRLRNEQKKMHLRLYQIQHFGIALRVSTLIVFCLFGFEPKS